MNQENIKAINSHSDSICLSTDGKIYYKGISISIS